jgi:hypothetical protein
MVPHLFNQIRFYHYISTVLACQASDPLCSACKAYANTVSALRESLATLEMAHADQCNVLPVEMRRMLEEARRGMDAVHPPLNSIGQKKAGNCKMPEGVCFIKSSKSIIDRL